MRPSILSVHPHDDRDLGYRIVAPNMLAHYYRSHSRSGVAIAHCGFVASKSILIDAGNSIKCEWCMTVEDMRDSLDKAVKGDQHDRA